MLTDTLHYYMPGDEPDWDAPVYEGWDCNPLARLADDSDDTDGNDWLPAMLERH